MKKEILISRLKENHQSLVDDVLSMNKVDFTHSANGKWTAGQHLDHIFRSVSPLILAFTLPKFMLGLLFGKTNRPSRSYDELVERYHQKLKTGGAASGRFVPKEILFENREQLKTKTLGTVDKLCNKIANCSESDLDIYILPHPLLGKLTLREMLYFTIYHAEHHHKLVK